MDLGFGLGKVEPYPFLAYTNSVDPVISFRTQASIYLSDHLSINVLDL